MRLYFGYISKNLLGPLLVITFTLTGIVWLTQALKFIDLIVNKGLGVSTFLYIAILLIPSLLLVILPVAMLCAVVFIYNRLIVDSELVVLNNAGLSKIGLAKPALFVAGCVTFVGYLISFYILPASYKEFKDTQVFIRNNYASVLLQEGVFNSPVTGLTVYIDARDRDGRLKGILVHDNRDTKKPITYMAEEGKLIRTDAGPRLILVKGSEQILKDNKIHVLDFAHYTMDLSVYTKQEDYRIREAEERYIHELFLPGDVSESFRKKLRVEGHHRIVWPLFALVFTFIAVAALLTGQFNRRGQWFRILSLALMSLGVIAIYVLLKSAGVKGGHFLFLMYVSAVVPMLIGSYYLWRNEMVQKRSSSVRPKEVERAG